MTPESTIRLVQTKSSDYRVVPATGVWGGVTPGGILRMDFFVDSIRPEESSVLPLQPDGKIRMADAAIGRYLERETQVGIAMSLETAERVANWLLGRVNQAKGRMQK